MLWINTNLSPQSFGSKLVIRLISVDIDYVTMDQTANQSGGHCVIIDYQTSDENCADAFAYLYVRT